MIALKLIVVNANRRLDKRCRVYIFQQWKCGLNVIVVLEGSWLINVLVGLDQRESAYVLPMP